MNLEELQQLFCTKINMELARYKRKMRQKEPEEIISKAYQINAMTEIYEVLTEKSLCMTEQALRLLLVLPDTLALFYSKWLKYEDSARKELDDSVTRTMEFLNVSYETADKEERQVAAA